MTTTEPELKKIAALAYLEIDNKKSQQLAHDVSSIMNFIEQLRQIDTKSVQPLSHPLNLHQRLRQDEITESNVVKELERLAPSFENSLYLVPKVVDKG